ncbi:hypothetical protein NUW54_g7604 [Trametes sanguinea]|uniref:Uncharacterized protein n=1 Tax=Trametes sanguinea TaxID=158606 RepID=A0ACC1PMK2_9APHY|nr:hypothetical protein NUW54_g7604 [Trametes sanguinea]
MANMLHSFPRDVSGAQDPSRDVSWMHRTFGSVLIGCYLGFIIYGLNIHQAIRYFKTFPKDHYYLKLLVASVLLWETCHAAFAMYTWLVHRVCQSFRAQQPPKLPLLGRQLLQSVSPEGWLLILSVFAVRPSLDMFGSNRLRLYHLFNSVGGRSKILVVLAVVFIFAELGDHTHVLSGHRFIKQTFQAYADVTWITSIAYGMAAVLDALLTAVLIYALRRCRTGMQRYTMAGLCTIPPSHWETLPYRTDSLLDVLILYSISTGEGFSFCKVGRDTNRAPASHHRAAHLAQESVSRSKTLIQPSDFVWFALNIVATKGESSCSCPASPILSSPILMYGILACSVSRIPLCSVRHDVLCALSLVEPRLIASSVISLNTRQVLAEQGNGAAAVYGGATVSSNFMSPTRSTLRLSRWTVLGVLSLFIPLQRSQGSPHCLFLAPAAFTSKRSHWK